MIYVPDSRDVAGAVRRSRRLHWTLQGARAKAEGWAKELGHEICWESVDDLTLIGRMPGQLWSWPASCCPKALTERKKGSNPRDAALSRSLDLGG